MLAALSYAVRGWPVFPVHWPEGGKCSCKGAACEHVGKHPRNENGVTGATCDEATIRSWWTRWPRANVGIALGGGRLALDVDGPEGRESLKGLYLPQTVIAETPRADGGLHYYFTVDPNLPLKNATGLRAGLDVKVAGGYCVAPPSLHETGGHYRWADGFSPDDQDLAPCPDWLLDALGAHKKTTAPASAPSIAPEDELRKGFRNATLTSMAGAMRRKGMSERAIAAALLEENRSRCKPPLGEAEVREIAKSVARYDPHDATGEIIEPQPAAAEDAEDTADWRRIFELGWRSGALGDLEAGEELKTMVAEEEPGEETPAAEAVAEREDQ